MADNFAKPARDQMPGISGPDFFGHETFNQLAACIDSTYEHGSGRSVQKLSNPHF